MADICRCKCKACIDSLTYFYEKTCNSHPTILVKRHPTIHDRQILLLPFLSPLFFHPSPFFYSPFRSIFYSVFYSCACFFARVAHPSYTKKNRETSSFSLRHTSAALRQRRTIGCLKSIQYQVPQALQVQKIKTQTLELESIDSRENIPGF